MLRMEGKMDRRGKVIAVLLAVMLAAYFCFGLNHLTRFETADEHYWTYSNYNNGDYWKENNGRIWQYWNAVSRGDWKMTRINDKPGVTLAYVSGIGSYLKTRLERGILSGAIAPLAGPEKAQLVNLYFRLPLLIFNGLFSLFLFFLVRKLTKNDWIALLTAGFILLSPILLGISQIINPDALLWLFAFSSLVSFLIFLEDPSWKYALSAGFFFGLALLSKYSSIILLPFLFAVLVIYLIRNVREMEVERIAGEIKKRAWGYLAIIFGALLVYAVLLPDNLVNFNHFMKGGLGFRGMQYFFLSIFAVDLLLIADARFGRARVLRMMSVRLGWAEKYFRLLVSAALLIIFAAVCLNGMLASDPLKLFRYPFDAPVSTVFHNMAAWKIFLMQFLPLVFSVSPLVLLALGWTWINSFRKGARYDWLVFVLSFFVLTVIAASMNQKVILSVRYSIMLYPAVFLLAAIGAEELLQLDKRKVLPGAGIFAAIVIFLLISLAGSQPFYFNYSNFLLAKNHSISDAWGYGGYEAAQYLNDLPGGGDLNILADYNGACVFINGDCHANKVTIEGLLSNVEKKGEIYSFDYLVSTRRGRMLGNRLWKDLNVQYDLVLEKEFRINGDPSNFVRIYKVSIKNNDEEKE